MKFSAALKVSAVALVSTVGLAACRNSSQSGQSGKVKNLNWAEGSNLPTLDPSMSTDHISAYTLQNSNQGLLVLSNNNKLTPGIAKSYKVTNKGKTYTFNLRKAKWSNGKELTAKDFVYGAQRTANPKTASQYSSLLSHVQNFSAVNKGKAPVSSLGVKASGKYKVVYNLSQAQPYFKYIVSMAPLGPQSQQIVNKYGSKYGTQSDKMVYSGPFKVTGWTGSNDSWTLSRNKNYWNNAATEVNSIKVNVIKDANTGLNEYQSGKLDELILSGKQQVANFKNSPELHKRANSATFYLQMNQKKDPAFKNVKIRQALSMAIDRNQLTNDVLGDGSTPVSNLVPRSMSYQKGKDFYDASTLNGVNDYNLTKAKQLFKEGLKEVGKKSLNFTILSDDTPTGKATTEFLQSQFSKLPGLNVSNSNVPFKTRLTQTQKGQFDVVVTAWIADYPDPDNFLQLIAKDNAYNSGKWSNPEFEKYYNAAEGSDAANDNKRWDDMIKADQVAQKQVAVVPLYQQIQPQVLKSKVQGLGYSTTGASWDFRDVK